MERSTINVCVAASSSSYCSITNTIQLPPPTTYRAATHSPWIHLNCITSSNNSRWVHAFGRDAGLYSNNSFDSNTGAYKSLVDLTLPDPNSADYTPALVYQARSYIAVDNPAAVIKLIPSYTENVALKAALGLAKYVAATEEADKESALEELRDLSLEIEGDDVEADEREKGFVRVLAGTAFARAGEIEEALETLGGTGTRENLEACVLHINYFLPYKINHSLHLSLQRRCDRADLPVDQPPGPCSQGTRQS